MPGQLFADLDDINAHLAYDKIKMQDGQDDLLQIDAYRLIRSRLSATFTLALVDLWVDPDTTPEMIREIAGKLIAAKWYAQLVSEDEPDGSAYAQGLYNEAIASLEDIRSGNITIIDADGLELTTDTISTTSFWPNDTIAPSFTVGDTWG